MPTPSLETLAAWIRTESPTHDSAGVNRMMDLAAAQARGAPIAVERVPGRQGLGDALVLRAGPQTAEPAILLLVHLDTVHPVGTIDRELPLRIEGDRLYGPGVYDMKGGAFLALEAFKDVARAGTATRPLVLLVTPDEEIGSPTSRELIEDHARRAAYALVAEPARDGGRIVTARSGIGRFDVEVRGRAAHAGTRHRDGRNAIHEAARQIATIEAMTDYERGITTAVCMIEAGTAVNTVPALCRFSVDLRIASAAQGDELASAILGLEAIAPDFEVHVEGGLNRPPYDRTEEIDRLFAHARGLAAVLGIDLASVPRVGGGSDGNFTAALGVPTLDGLGIDGDGAHTHHEHGLVSSIEPRRHLMRRLLETL
ncbi:M20 family peptidase [Lichenibacterium minor]|uniref:M20 family peptidase n=1 Tax=Lichenibacterium minor TaxID=2316528 RepID=A0A4Q2U065_9HYPH|nr:M20 family metallopeptidase [Lichenibacterium minor]RYC29799.1 M20 family peptidase [Lichenibacterium minor]